MQLDSRIEEQLPALKRVVRSFSPYVLAKVSADDIVQQTCLLALKAGNRFEYRSDHELLAWLTTIAKNFANSAINKRVNQERQLPGEIANESGILSPSKALAKKETQAAFKNALQQLSRNHQILFELHYKNGEPLCDIAPLLEMSPEAVRGQHRSLKVKLCNLLPTWVYSTLIKKARKSHG